MSDWHPDYCKEADGHFAARGVEMDHHCCHELPDDHDCFPGTICCHCGDLFEPLSDDTDHGPYKPVIITMTVSKLSSP